MPKSQTKAKTKRQSNDDKDAHSTDDKDNRKTLVGGLCFYRLRGGRIEMRLFLLASHPVFSITRPASDQKRAFEFAGSCRAEKENKNKKKN